MMLGCAHSTPSPTLRCQPADLQLCDVAQPAARNKSRAEAVRVRQVDSELLKTCALKHEGLVVCVKAWSS